MSHSSFFVKFFRQPKSSQCCTQRISAYHKGLNHIPNQTAFFPYDIHPVSPSKKLNISPSSAIQDKGLMNLKPDENSTRFSSKKHLKTPLFSSNFSSTETAMKRRPSKQNKNTPQRRPKEKGVYLRAVVNGEEKYDVSIITKAGRRKSKKVTVPTDASNLEFLTLIHKAQDELFTQDYQQSIEDLSYYISSYAGQRQLSQNSVRLFKYCLKGFTLNDTINRQKVDEIMNSSFSAGTKRIYIKRIRAFFTFLITTHHLQISDPTKGVRMPQASPRSRVPTKQEVDLLLESLMKAPEEDQLFARLLLHTGARCSTIIKVRPCDMDDSWHLGLFNKKVGRKYSILLPITDEYTRTLWSSVTADKKPTDPIFSYHHHTHLRKRMVRLFKRDENGESLSPHSLRHLMATTLALKNVPVKLAAAILDCSPAVMLSVYTTIQQQDVDSVFGLNDDKKKD